MTEPIVAPCPWVVYDSVLKMYNSDAILSVLRHLHEDALALEADVEQCRREHEELATRADAEVERACGK